MNEQIRVRFAPSPTGYLHVGGARTALFNWLFARHTGGKFILRIEDTDFIRSSDEMVDGILRALQWMGLTWDEGPFYQSDRLTGYRAMARQMLAAGHAYRCFCGAENGHKEYPENVPAARHECATLTPEAAERRAAGGEAYAIRFRVPPGKTSFHDMVFGPIEVDNAILEDFVLLRSDGIPTYHLSVVMDDMDMNITHIIRGADHISNTPKQILLYRAADRPVPRFAHLPLILGPDRQRLSKRHGATSVMAYADDGYQPEAFFNFLALLGWSPGDDREIFTAAELVESFTLEGVGKANAVFGLDKLDWFNSQYLRALPAEKLRELAEAKLKKNGLWPDFVALVPEPERMATLTATLELIRPRLRKLDDLAGNFRAFFTADFPYDAAAIAKFLAAPALRELIPALMEQYRAMPDFTLQATEEALRAVAAAGGVKAGVLINALRVALTGQGVAPGLFEIMQVLGRERTLERMERLGARLN